MIFFRSCQPSRSVFECNSNQTHSGHFLFGKWKYKTEELHSYNQALINAFMVQPEPKKANPIGFKIGNNKKQSKKKKNENKSKTN